MKYLNSRIFLIAVTAFQLLACAHRPPGTAADPRDRFERLNRSVYRFNTVVDHSVLRPVARGYVRVVPTPVRTGVSHVLDNLDYTKTIGNDIFQAQFVDFLSDGARLVVNTTLGIGGIFDPAGRMGLVRHERDFGQTLGIWGLPTGPYLVLPLLGPSDVRDAVGLVPDHFMAVEPYLFNTGVQLGISVARAVDRRSELLSLDGVVDAAYDPYVFMRSAWFQRRDYKVRGESAIEDPLQQSEL